MSDSGDLTEADVQRVVREEVSKAGRSLLSTVVWTVLGVFGVLVDLQSIQISVYSLGVVAAGFVVFGVVVTASSAHLLYVLHAEEATANVQVRERANSPRRRREPTSRLITW